MDPTAWTRVGKRGGPGCVCSGRHRVPLGPHMEPHCIPYAATRRFSPLVVDYLAGDERLREHALFPPGLTGLKRAAMARTFDPGARAVLVEALQPRWLRIGGYWYPRGGIPIDVFWQTGAPPEGLWVPDQGVPSYRGRG